MSQTNLKDLKLSEGCTSELKDFLSFSEALCTTCANTGDPFVKPVRPWWDNETVGQPLWNPGGTFVKPLWNSCETLVRNLFETLFEIVVQSAWRKNNMCETLPETVLWSIVKPVRNCDEIVVGPLVKTVLNRLRNPCETACENCWKPLVRPWWHPCEAGCGTFVRPLWDLCETACETAVNLFWNLARPWWTVMKPLWIRGETFVKLWWNRSETCLDFVHLVCGAFCRTCLEHVLKVLLMYWWMMPRMLMDFLGQTESPQTSVWPAR